MLTNPAMLKALAALALGKLLFNYSASLLFWVRWRYVECTYVE
jgi:hypothetical protein